jgi:hypothetical protein
MTTPTANGEQFLELCKAVVEAAREGEDLQTAASALARRIHLQHDGLRDHEGVPPHRSEGRLRLLERHRRLTTSARRASCLSRPLSLDDNIEQDAGTPR